MTHSILLPDDISPLAPYGIAGTVTGTHIQLADGSAIEVKHRHDLSWCTCADDCEDCEHVSVSEVLDALAEWAVGTRLAVTNLRDLLAAMRLGLYAEREWAELPTFGGYSPDDVSGIWSWDAKSFLIGDCASELEIVSRDEWNEVAS